MSVGGEYAPRLHRPTNLEQATALLLALPRSVILAGGQHLIPSWRNDCPPPDVVSMSSVPEMKCIEIDGAHLVIGAACTHRDVAESRLVRERLPALAGLTGRIGDCFLRNRATVGGAIFTTGHAGCYPAALIGMAATVRTSTREVDSENWFSQTRGHARLESGEIVTAIRIPIPDKASHHYLRLVPARFAQVTIFASMVGGSSRVGISGLTNRAFRARSAEIWLSHTKSPEVDVFRELEESQLRTDDGVDPAYRLSVANMLLRQARDELLGISPGTELD